MNYGLNKKSNKRKQFLLKLLAIAMVISMMPYQSLSTAYAAEPESVPSSTESADPTGTQNDQGEVDQTEGDQNQDDVDKQEEPQKDPPEVTKEDNKKGATKGEGEGEGGNTNTLSPKEQADAYYGPNATNPARTYTVKLTETGNHSTAEAGETITYNVNISMYPAATYAYNGQDQTAMFTKWEHITIKLKLSPDQEIDNVIGGSIRETDPNDPNDKPFHYDQANDVWTIDLKQDWRDATNSNSIVFDVETRIKDNGALPDGKVLHVNGDNTIGAKVTVDTDFDLIVDEYGHTGSQQTPQIPRYEFTKTSQTPPITLTTPDKWTLTKSPYEHSYTINDDDPDKNNWTVTVHYRIKYGLDVGGAPSEDPNSYTSIGRVPFDHDLELTDKPKLTLATGSTLAAESVTVTPLATGYKYKNGNTHPNGSDGNPEPITVDSNGHATLPYAVVGTNNKYVDENAPAFSEYDVDMVYKYSEFMVWFHQNLPKTDAHSENTANIKYQLLGQSTIKETEDDGETDIPSYINPGKITIEKYIVNYDSNQEHLYDSSIKAPVTGAATYKIYKSDGTTPATIYYKDSDGKYQPISGNTVTINPSATASETNGTNGTISFFLDAGEYKVKETGRPANTLNVGSDTKTVKPTELKNGEGGVTAAFRNKEQLGQIKIKKTDDTNNHNLLTGVKFGLYEDKNHTTPIVDENGHPIVVTTESGYATFKRLVPGTYYIWETYAPEGIVKYKDSIEVEVTVNNTAESYTIPVENHKDGKTILLQKQYSTVENPSNFINVGPENYMLFENKFVLEKSIDGEDWTTVRVCSLDENGRTYVDVAEYDNQGNKIQYRFKETIPSGYYDVNYQSGTAYSRVVIPADCTTDEQLRIVMQNTRKGIIELTKYKVAINTNSGLYVTAPDNGRVFKLYRTVGNSIVVDPNFVDQATTDSDGKIRFTELPAKVGNDLYTYYVVEQGTESGFNWQTNATIKINNADTPALRIGSFDGSNGGTLDATTFNTEQKIRIGIVKKDKLNGGQLANAKFKVSYGTHESTVTTFDGNKVAYLPIELGENYTITETEVPDGYYIDEPSTATIDTRGWTVKKESNGSVSIYKADGTTKVNPEDLVFTFEDTPYKKIRVTKKVQKKGSNQTSDLSDITFSIYVKDGDKYVPYKDANGNPVTIDADGQTTVSLPANTYYLHEENPPITVLDPDKYSGEYIAMGAGNLGLNEKEEMKFFFGPYEVKKPPQNNGSEVGDGDLLWSIGVINVANAADIVVSKRSYDKDNTRILNDPGAVNGFYMRLFKTDANGNKIGNYLQEVRTSGTGDNAGKALFTDVQIYDEQGNKIYYIVEEVYKGTQGETWYTDDPVSSNTTDTPIVLTQGQTGETAADAGYVENHKKMSVQVTKKYYNAREYQLTGLEYVLEGAVIALYKNNGDGTYTFVRTGVTNSKGNYEFGELKFSQNGYVAVEVSVPNRPEFKYMVPESGNYLEKIDGDYPQTLYDTNDDPRLVISNLSRVALTASNEEAHNYKGTIYNVIPWTQIHITKYDNTTLPTHKLNGADFTLYKQVLPEGTASGTLTFDPNNCTVVGEYTSGTWIFNGETVQGEFQTDVLDNANNIVYWLVEDRAPSGYSIYPEEKVILFTREGTNYTNSSNGGASTRVCTLKDNQINYAEVHNKPGSGTGEDTENRAFIEFTKWMQDPDTAETPRADLQRSDFELMPNATFELYAVNKTTHNKVYLLDTITTGDENLVDPALDTTGYGVSRALDAWEIFNYIEQKYPDQLNDIMTYQSTGNPSVTYPYKLGDDGKPVLDDHGNRIRIPGTFWLNAVLVEKSGSSAYELDLHDHNLQIKFPTGSLELGNNKYAVPVLVNSSAVFCDSAQGKTRRDSYTNNDPNSVAIVDYLSVDNSVVLRHFGYDPEMLGGYDGGYELFHSDLDAKYSNNPAAFVSKQVKFALEKYNVTDKKWEAWSPTTNQSVTASGANEFTTDGNGYHFNSGLKPGEYRVVMKTAATGYENFYPNNNVAFHFTVIVTDRTQTFTTYSPSRPEMSIEKKDLNGNTITQEAKFKLIKKSGSGSSYSKEVTTVNGKAVFTGLPANDKFILTEEEAPAGYSNKYFAKLFKEKYSAYTALVEGNTGYPLSYVTVADSPDPSTTSLDGTVVKETIIQKKHYNEAFSLEVRNPKDVKLELTKEDSQTSDKLKDAKFEVYYYAFNTVSGDYDVPAFSADTWTDLGSVTTGEDGTFTITDDTFDNYNIEPGVYYVKETEAPPHYQLNTTGQGIVMTSGLPLTIRNNPNQFTICTDVGGTGKLTFKDIPLEKITVQKEVKTGSFTEEPWDFEFQLKEEGSSTLIQGDPSHATGPSTPPQPAEFKDLTQGQTYYLKEVEQTGYKLQSVQKGNEILTPESSGNYAGYYKIKMPENGDSVTVKFTNILMQAKVTIFKYDGETGQGLEGAEFDVLDAQGNVVNKATVTDDGNGKYTAVIPLEDENGANFYIHETKAPTGKNYAIDPSNDRILVKNLKPGQHQRYTFNGVDSGENELVLPNYEGVKVKITKYGGLPGGTHSVLAGAKFQMYFSTDGGNNWNSWHDPETTDADGKAEFLVLKKYMYAIAEKGDVNGYVGLYGIYNEQGGKLNQVEDGNNILNIIGQPDDDVQEYHLTGYNIPYLKLIVNKHDFDKEKSGPNPVENPDTEFTVYEVKDNTPQTLTEADISTAISWSIANTGVNGHLSGETLNSTFENEKFIQPGKTYLAVETHAIDRDSSGDDYSIIKDDTRVVSYQVFKVPLEGYKDKYEVDFWNIKGKAEVDLEKTVDPTKVDSLTLSSAELEYTLKPTSINSYALEENEDGYAYRLKDSGLRPDPTDATLASEWYNITEVTVGQGSMKHYLKGANADEYSIYATVTFVDFEGHEYTQRPAVDVTNGNATVIPTGEAAGKNIKSFYIDYCSPDLMEDTKDTATGFKGYALGQNFSAGITSFKATVFKQESPDKTSITALDKVINDADVALSFADWNSTGVKNSKITTLRANDDAETEVDVAKAPKIRFDKSGPEMTTALDLDSPIKYTLKVENISTENLDFNDPIVVDLLPQGVSLNTSSSFIDIVHKPDTINDNPQVTTGYAGDSQYVNIAFSGKIGAGDYIEIELNAKITSAVTNYGSAMKNFACTTSKQVGVATSDNATGAVIKDDEGNWAGELVAVAKRNHCDEERAKALKKALGDGPGEQGTYGYLGDWWQNVWVSANDLICVKAEYGPLDGGIYRTDNVSLLVNDEDDVTQRTMHYQLTINNVSSTKRTNMAVMDIMPVVGDQRINNTTRGSHWPLYFDDIKSVMVNGAKCDKYKVYYYTGRAQDFDSDDITDIVNASKAGCPEGWTATKPDAPITAFILAFDYSDSSTVILDANENVQIEYTATTPYREAEELNPIVFTNAANDFNFGFSTMKPGSKSGAKAETKADDVVAFDPLGSNVVEVTITPPVVKVGGDVWIDANSDGWQNDGDQSWYLRYKIVQDLVGDAANNDPGDLDVKLNTSNNQDYSISTGVTQGTINRTGSDPNNYGVAHFEFDDLTAAKLRAEYAGNYENWNENRNAKELVGSHPYSYNMSMGYKGNVFTKTVNKVDPRGSYVPGNIPEDDQKDDNFATSRAVDTHTEQFFLHQTSDVFDMTKDYGVNAPKVLDLTKVSKSNGDKKVDGAVFEIYGPFAHGTGKTAELSSSNLVGTFTTDSDGKIVIDKDNDGNSILFFFMEYVIVEKSAGQGYTIDGATAQGNIEKIAEGKWLLNVPPDDAVPSVDNPYTEQVIVSDPETIKVSVEKDWNDNNDEYGNRPDSIKVMLYTNEACTTAAVDANGDEVESKTLNAQNSWKAEWTNLPRYKNSAAIKYYVKETTSTGAELKGYDVEITRQPDGNDPGDQSLTIKNTPYSTGLDIKKTWDDNEELAGQVVAAKFRVEQSSDGQTWTPTKKKVNGAEEEIIVTINRSVGTAEVTGLPANDEQDNPLTYRAVEIAIIVDADGQTHELKVVNGKVGPYEVIETHTPDDNTATPAKEKDLSEITNKMITTEFNAEKTFVDDNYDFNKEIKAITVVLQRKCGNSDWFTVSDKTGADSFDLTADNEWKYKWEGLPKLRWDGEPFEYRAVEVSYTTKSGTVVQVDFNGDDLTSGTVGSYIYTSQTEGTADDGYKTFIENKLVKTGLKVTKEWKNADDDNMPESVTIALKAIVNGKEITLNGVPKTVVLNKANNWTDDTTWSDLPVYYVDGSKIGYQLVETTKGKYTTKYKIKLKGSIINEGEGKMLIVHVHKGSTVEAAFINTMNETDTGDGTPILPFLALCLASLAGLLTLLFGRRRTE